QPGDIVLTKGTSLYDRLIQFGTHSQWNHVGVVESVSPKSVSILEMTSEGCTRSVLSRPTANWSFRDVGKTAAERADGLRWAEMVYSRHISYGWFDILMILLRIVLPWWSLTVADGKMFCSQFACGMLAHAGDDTFNVDEFVSPGDMDKAFPIEVT
ncbi:MAG TPA: hypothetical protein VGN15_10835, partial [Ktedonobacteraceae bacterium]|nr:hypothetical protein [Ktedonobacteraceae bacterium]